MTPTMRATVRTAAVSLALSWLYAAVYGLRRTGVLEQLPQRELFGRRQVDPGEVALIADVLDWSIIAWVVLPVLLLASVLTVALVGVGHVAVLVLGVASTPVLPLFGAYFPLDPVLAVVAAAQGIAAALVVVQFVRALAASR
ncbi:hypothetical protein [Cellulomonas sp. ATA003]|uniref:hypothetical protein n=1 Tax=Cellulomonas sp. ATA003 TaxID=3073064 RepID=UPI0028739977|nr:hypothetical protein [Cellulomonas sp. ATA003]WNB85735.1 hypothetical protein REH70_19920 [Cellulomonas sp. ATA003]